MFLGIGVGRVYSGAVLPMFLLYYLVFRSRNVSRKFSSGQVRCLNKFSGANFCFLGLLHYDLQLYCHSFRFPLLEGGNAVRFFHFVFFVSGMGVFCRFLPFFSS